MAERIERELVITSKSDKAIKDVERLENNLLAIEEQARRTANATNLWAESISQPLPFDEINKTTRALKAQEDQLKRNANAGGNGRDVLKDDYGDLSTSFGALGSAISALGGSESAANAARTIGDVTGAIEYAGAAMTALGGAAATFIPLIAIGGALAFAFSEVARQQEAAAAAAKAYSDELTSSIAREFEAGQLLTSGNTDGIRAKLDAAKAERDLQKSIIDTATARRDEAKSIDELASADGGLTSQYLDGKITLEEYTKTLEGLDSTIAGSNQAIEAATPIYDKASEAVGYYSSVVDSQAFKLAETASKIEDLNAKQDQLVDAYKAAENQVDSYAKQITDLNKSFSQQNTRTSVVNIMQDVFDATEKAITQQERLADQETARLERQDGYYKRINAIQDEADKKAVDTAEAIKKVNTDSDESLLELQSKYQDEATKRAAEYLKKRQQLEDDFAQGRYDALLDNDVRQFEKFSRDEEKKALGELRDERRAEKDEAKKQLADERQKIIDNANERISQLDRELAEFTANTEAKLAVEKQAFQDSETKITERLELETQRANDRAQRRENFEDRLAEIRAKWRQDDHNKQIENLSELKANATDAFDAIEKSLTQTAGAAKKYQEEIDAAFRTAQEGINGIIEAFGGKPVPLIQPSTNSITLPPPVLPLPPGGNNTKTYPAGMQANSGQMPAVNLEGMFSGANFGNIMTTEDGQALSNAVMAGVVKAVELLAGMTQG